MYMGQSKQNWRSKFVNMSVNVRVNRLQFHLIQQMTMVFQSIELPLVTNAYSTKKDSLVLLILPDSGLESQFGGQLILWFLLCFTIVRYYCHKKRTYLYFLRNCLPFSEHTDATRQTVFKHITKQRSSIPVVENSSLKILRYSTKSDEETISEFD